MTIKYCAHEVPKRTKHQQGHTKLLTEYWDRYKDPNHRFFPLKYDFWNILAIFAASEHGKATVCFTHKPLWYRSDIRQEHVFIPAASNGTPTEYHVEPQNRTHKTDTPKTTETHRDAEATGRHPPKENEAFPQNH